MAFVAFTTSFAQDFLRHRRAAGPGTMASYDTLFAAGTGGAGLVACRPSLLAGIAAGAVGQQRLQPDRIAGGAHAAMHADAGGARGYGRKLAFLAMRWVVGAGQQAAGQAAPCWMRSAMDARPV